MEVTPAEKTGFQIRRNIAPLLFGLVITSTFIAIWMVEEIYGIGADFVVSPGFTAFIFVGVTPIGLLLVYLMINEDPVICVRDSSVHVVNPTFPWRKATLGAGDIVGIETDWLPDTSRARIVFYVTPDCFAEQKRSGPWIKRKNGKLHLDVLNTGCTPQQIADHLRTVLQLDSEISVARK